MFEHKTHSIPDRIVSISQHWVRPVVRGKAHQNTEFGAKLHISLVDGYARILQLNFNVFHESEDFENAYKVIKPLMDSTLQKFLRIKRIEIEKLYSTARNVVLSCRVLNYENLKNVEISKELKKEEYTDICKRNAVEGALGTGKTRYGLGRIMASFEDTSKTIIAMSLFCFNLSKRLREILLFLKIVIFFLILFV